MQHDNTAPTVGTVAQLFQSIVYGNKDQLSAGIIVAGWDAQNGASVYNIPLGGGMFKADWAIGGSGSSYIYGFCDSTWQKGWDKERTIDFVRDGQFPFDSVSLFYLLKSIMWFLPSFSTRSGHVARRLIWWRHPHGSNNRRRRRTLVCPRK